MEQTGQKQGIFRRLFRGLAKTRAGIASGLASVFRLSKIDDDFYEEIEEILVMGDLGIGTATKVIDDLKEKVAAQGIKEPAACRELLMNSIKEQMAVDETAYPFESTQSVILVIGVNGAGKTTTIGKLAAQLSGMGRKVVIAAADTFRAAATEQLVTWAQRAGVDIVTGHENADPSSVVYDAISATRARGADVLICDTAGRLHNKKNLMEELKKIYRILERDFPEAHLETLVVLDGTTGQNALAQAKSFAESAEVTGIVITKLDGTAKGGIAVAVQAELQVPVKYIGVGEGVEDLQKFDPETFVRALFATDEEGGPEAGEGET